MSQKSCKSRKTGKKWVDSDALYVCDLEVNQAHFFQKGTRGHWQIENNLHWVKDVVHNEDKSQVKNPSGAVNLAIMSSVALNLHRRFGEKSITDSQAKFNANLMKAIQVIRT